MTGLGKYQVHGFAQAHHKIPPRGKSERGLGLGSSLKFGVPLNISAMAETSDLK